MSNGASPLATPGTVLVDVDDPTTPGLDLAAAEEGAVRAVTLRGCRRLAADEPRATLATVRLLRDASSYGIPVAWQGGTGPGVDTARLVHLPPPEPMAGEEADPAVEEWRRQHRPGLCYYRLGPDFVVVKDVRRPGDTARFRLAGEGVVAAFRAIEAVVEVDRLDAQAAGLLADLEGEGLALRLGGLGTLLPSRMRRWPVPALDV